MNMERALAEIDLAVERSYKHRGATPAVIEALRFLSAKGVERKTLVWFWNAIRGDNEIGRSQNANASRNRIKFLLGVRPK